MDSLYLLSKMLGDSLRADRRAFEREARNCAISARKSLANEAASTRAELRQLNDQLRDELKAFAKEL